MMKRLKQYLYLYFTDHGILRALYKNFHRLPGDLYRCNQPSPRQLKLYKERYGIRTVVNLRGGDTSNPSWQLESDACQKLGLTLVNLRLLSRSFPEPHQVLEACEVIRNIEYPALVHCKSGADRAGFFSTLYRVVRLGEPVEQAIEEMGIRYGHISWAQTGVLDEFFWAYRDSLAVNPRSLASWMENGYERERVKAKSSNRGLVKNLGNFLVNRVLHRE
jgi:protein tyrosine/serine phosphatase